MKITMKEYRLLQSAERIISGDNVTPDMAMKAARFLMAYSKLMKERQNTDPREHQMSIFQENSWIVMDDYTVRMIGPDEKIDFGHILAMTADEYDAHIIAHDLEALASEREDW